MTEHPGTLLREKMEERGWTQEELAVITGSSRQTIYSILAGKSNVSPEMAVTFAAAFGNSPEEWLRWDSLYRLSITDRDTSEVGILAKCYSIAPIKDMAKRGWIPPDTENAKELERALKKFFGKDSLENVTLHLAPRRTAIVPELHTSEKAWCFRARQLAASQAVAPYSERGVKSAKSKLRKLAAYSKEARHVPKVLTECGIRFVIIEPIPNVKIDGASFWLDDGPAIAMSLRHDRIDGFWFTLMHEMAHVENGDAAVDPDLIDGTKGIAIRLVENEAERIADERAADSLVPTSELKSFIQRVGPFYPTTRIVQFANRMKVHPGVIVGQLQHRQELPYAQQRDFLVKIREIVTSTALTDGWDQIVAPNSL